MLDNSSNNKIKLSMGYKNKHPKNKININITVNKKALQNKTPKNIKTPLHNNLSEMIISYASKDNKCRNNYIFGNNGNINKKLSPSNKKQNIFEIIGNYGKKSINNNMNMGNHSISIYQKKDLSNNLSSLKNLKRNNNNSKSYNKLATTKKVNIGSNSNKKPYKENLNYCYFNDNINNNISYNLGKKNAIISRNHSNYGINCNNYNTYYSNNNFKTINNFNKKNSNSNSICNLHTEENNINNIKFNTNYNENNAFSMKIQNKINLNKNKMNQCLNRNINNDKKKTIINKSSSYLLNKEIDAKKINIKRAVCLNDENNKNETPSFYLYRNKK
jgi:hypothetical protein